jgi:O-antigen ligase
MFGITLAVVILSGLGIWIRPSPAASSLSLLRFLKQLFQLIVMTCFVVAPVLWVCTAGQWVRVRRLLVVGFLFQVGYSLMQGIHFFQPLPVFPTLESWFTSNPAILAGSEELFLKDGFVGLPRLRGTACEPLYLGNYLLLVIPCLFLPGGRKVPTALLVFSGLGLLLWTWARGAYLAGLFAAVVGVVLWRRAGFPFRTWIWLRWGLVSLVLVGALVSLCFGLQSLLLPWQRLLQSFNTEDWSNLTRVYSMQAAWRVFLSSPILGVGWGQFAFHFPEAADPLGLQSQFAWPVVNNFPLKILCETGLVGFLVFLVWVATLASRVWDAVAAHSVRGSRLGPEGRLKVVVSATAVAGVWSQLLTFSQYNLPHIWFALGLLVAALQVVTVEKGPQGCSENPVGGTGSLAVPPPKGGGYG